MEINSVFSYNFADPSYHKIPHYVQNGSADRKYKEHLIARAYEKEKKMKSTTVKLF